MLRELRNGTDRASELAPLLNFVGVDRYYALARACGAVAALLATTSVLVSLRAGTMRRNGQPVPRWLSRSHRQVSLATILLVAAHAGLPFLSNFSPYGGWATALLPFRQPRSWGVRGSVGESLGILALYLMVAVGPSYYALRGKATPVWRWLHRCALLAYAAMVAHILFLGSDVLVAGPVRATFLLLQGVLAAQLGWRLGWAHLGTRILSGVAFVCSLALCAAGTAGLAGAPVGGLVLG